VDNKIESEQNVGDEICDDKFRSGIEVEFLPQTILSNFYHERLHLLTMILQLFSQI